MQQKFEIDITKLFAATINVRRTLSANVQKKKDFLFLESTNFYALCFSAKMNEVKKVTISLNIVRADILQISTIFAMIFYKNFYSKSCAEIAVFPSLN